MHATINIFYRIWRTFSSFTQCDTTSQWLFLIVYSFSVFPWLHSSFAGFLRFIINWCLCSHTFTLTHSLAPLTHIHTLTRIIFTCEAYSQPMHRVFRYAHTSSTTHVHREPRTVILLYCMLSVAKQNTPQTWRDVCLQHKLLHIHFILGRKSVWPCLMH